VRFADGLNPGGTAPADPRWGGMDQDTLLIVEEDILIRHPLAEYLRDCGFKVVEASGPADARVLIGDEAFHVDVLLISASEGTPDFGFVQWVRENRPGVEVMLAGSVNGAVKKASDLCEDQPGAAKPKYDHKVVEGRIRRFLAERARGNGEGEQLQ
jgi:DNA-binding NtrC family response regulator